MWRGKGVCQALRGHDGVHTLTPQTTTTYPLNTCGRCDTETTHLNMLKALHTSLHTHIHSYVSQFHINATEYDYKYHSPTSNNGAFSWGEIRWGFFFLKRWSY